MLKKAVLCQSNNRAEKLRKFDCGIYKKREKYSKVLQHKDVLRVENYVETVDNSL